MRQKSLIKQRREDSQKVEPVEKKPTRLDKSFATVSSTEEGMVILKEIAKICGWQISAIPVDSNGDIDLHRNLVQTSKRRVWSEIRKHIPLDRIIFLEQPELSEDEKQ